MIEAKVVKDSISDHGVRLLTMKLRMHRYVLAEFNTHRAFSRNASSSRAVPTTKLLEEVRSNALRAAPVSWGQNQKGMQAGEELKGDSRKLVEEVWSHAAADAAYHAERLMKRGAHKQVCNRILEPFLFVNVIVTATEWQNFFGLRLDKAAQPEMRALAEAMWAVFNESVPLRLSHGQWHLPFVDSEDIEEMWARAEVLDLPDDSDEAIKVSVARCARISYESHETGARSTIEADVKLHDFLLENRHFSPFEHIACPDTKEADIWQYPNKHGNFVGWIQHRKCILNENVASLPEMYRI